MNGELPNPNEHRSEHWIPIGASPPVPVDWKPPVKEEIVMPTPLKSDLGKMQQGLARLQLLAQNSPKSRIMARSKELMEKCKPGKEPCDRGWVDVWGPDGKPINGARFLCENKTLHCKQGSMEYVARCRQHLASIGFRGLLAEASFLRRAEHESMIAEGNPMILDEFAKQVYDWSFAGWRRNPLLLLHGPAGPGKTHCALATLAHFKVVHNQDGRLYNLVRLLRDRSTRDASLEEALRQEVLILDDMGQEINSDVNRANLYMIIDARISAWLPTIITTNLLFDEIVSHYNEERIDDRLMMFKSIVTNAGSKRGAR